VITPLRCKAMLTVALVLLAGCRLDLDVPPLNNPSADDPVTRGTIAAYAQRLLWHARTLSTEGSVGEGIRLHGVWARESYDLRPAQPLFYSENLIGPRNSSSVSTGAFFNYPTLAHSRDLLRMVNDADFLTNSEKEAIRGWTKTVMAVVYHYLAIAYPEFGAPLDAAADPTGDLAPLGTPVQLYERAITLFDEGAAHLQAGGTSFPFRLTDGYAGFNTPVKFVQVNRALKARTLKYMGQWRDAIAELQRSFIDPSASMTLGVYHTFLGPPETPNPFSNVSNDYLHPRIRANALRKLDGSLDKRALDKIRVIAPKVVMGIRVSEVPVQMLANSTFPWIRNEELLLIRAESNYALGNFATALSDVNVVREKAGGLAPIASLPSAAALLDEILYNRRYSLLWEGFAYFDAMQYGRLGPADLPRDLPTHRVFTRLNWPSNECLQRRMASGPCGQIEGIQ
jgi:starch-binding outer membrane protein, SusD/RagB family